jgi:hypothetical protein
MKISRSRVALAIIPCAIALLGLAGCGSGPETEYGSSVGKSINGTSVLAAALREEGHDVEAAIRLNDDLAEWAEGIIRFAPYPGPPDRAEAKWYDAWLAADPDRWLIYVVGDFDAAADYWKSVVKDLDGGPDEDGLKSARESLAETANWFGKLPPKSLAPADSAVWFEVDRAWEPPQICTGLGGAWGAGKRPQALEVTLHEPIKARGGTVLLTGDQRAFVIEKRWLGENRLLFIANGSFLVNEALVKAARLELLAAVFDWIGADRHQIALVEGMHVLEGAAQPPSFWGLLRRLPSLRWITAQIVLAALCAALARAPRLGRARVESGPPVDRPAAHAEALGLLLARSGAETQARTLVAEYRGWRYRGSSPQKVAASRPLRALKTTGRRTASGEREYPAVDSDKGSAALPRSAATSNRDATGRRASDG